MEAICSSERLVTIYQTTRCHITEGSDVRRKTSNCEWLPSVISSTSVYLLNPFATVPSIYNLKDSGNSMYHM
jgi:hypothetical protein